MACAFSLIEVIIAVGIFATGIVTMIGLFGPLAKSASGISDATAAAKVADLLRQELVIRTTRTHSFEVIAALLKEPEGISGENPSQIDPRADPQVLFANRDGTKVGGYNDPNWTSSELEKFFEITLLRNESTPPPDPDAAMFFYTASIRWPAFVVDLAVANPRHASPASRRQQSVLLLPGAVMR